MFLVYFICQIFVVYSLPILPNVVEETQHALCKISSADLQATANATITRQLKGVCTNAHLNERLTMLENIFTLEMNNLKTMLQSFVQNETNKKLLDDKLEFEINKLNMTIEKGHSDIKFHYYWKVNGIELSSVDERINSGDFHFAGYKLFLRLHRNYLQTEQIFVELVCLEPFDLAYRIKVLNIGKSNRNIESELLYCNGAPLQCFGHGLQIPYNRFILFNSIVIHLIIHLPNRNE